MWCNNSFLMFQHSNVIVISQYFQNKLEKLKLEKCNYYLKFNWKMNWICNKIEFEKCLCVRFSVCPSVCASSNFLKYFLDVLKFIYVIHIWYRMNCSENGVHVTKGSFAETHIFFFQYIKVYGGIFKTHFNI